MKAISLVALLKRPPLIALICIWTAILVLPRPRSIVRSSLHPWPQQYAIVSEDDEDSGATVITERLARYADLRARFPENVAIPMIMATLEDDRQAAGELKKLVAQHPDDLILGACYLRVCRDLFTHLPGSGPFSTLSNLDITGPPGTIGKVIQPQTLTATDRELLETAVSVCRRGQQLDSRNAYFDWALTGFNFRLERETEALQSLMSASRKTYYRDYFTEYAVSILDVRALNGPLSPVECGNIAAETFNYMPFVGARQTGYRIMDCVYDHRIRGDAAGAIRIATALMRTGKLIQLQGSTLMDYAVGAAVEKYAMRYWLHPDNKSRRVDANLGSTGNLAGFAHAHGMDGVAQESMAEAKRLAGLKGRQFPTVAWTGGSTSVLLTESALERIFRWFVFASLGLIPLWILSILALRPSRAFSVVTRRTHRGFVALAAILGFVATLVLDVRWFRAYQDLEDPAGFREFAWSAPLDVVAPSLTRALPIIALLFAAQICAAGALETRNPSITRKEQARRLGVEPNSLHALLIRTVPILVRLTISGLSLGFVGLFFYYFPDPDSSWTLPLRYIFWALPFFILIRLVKWALSTETRPAAAYFLALLAQSIPLLCLTIGILLGVAILVISPACATFESQLRAVISMGEWPFFRKIVGI